MQPAPDILALVAAHEPRPFCVGFAAETEELDQNAQQKLKEKNLDIIAGNLVGNPASGFASDTNRVTLYYRDGSRETVPEMEKDAVAHILLNRIVERLLPAGEPSAGQ